MSSPVNFFFSMTPFSHADFLLITSGNCTVELGHSSSCISLSYIQISLLSNFSILWPSRKNQSVSAAAGVARCSVHALNAITMMDKYPLVSQQYNKVKVATPGLLRN